MIFERILLTSLICFCFAMFPRTCNADSFGKELYVGIAVPFQGFGFYEDPEQGVAVWNLTPLSLETGLSNNWGFRFSVYTVYSTPQPEKVREFEFNFEFSRYLKYKSSQLDLSGLYVGPMFMVQYMDQDTGATLGGPGVTAGYRGIFSGDYWFRIGSYFAYHQYLSGPKEKLREIVGDSLSGGLFMGNTFFEIGRVF